MVITPDLRVGNMLDCQHWILAPMTSPMAPCKLLREKTFAHQGGFRICNLL